MNPTKHPRFIKELPAANLLLSETCPLAESSSRRWSSPASIRTSPFTRRTAIASACSASTTTTSSPSWAR
jgi:hypothetical protein